MTSINNQQYAPQYAYEMPPTQTPAPSGDNADAHAPNTSPDSSPLRASVGPEQRGQFSRHNSIVNQKSQGADSKSEIAELTQKHKNLIAKYNALHEKFSTKLSELNTKIDNLITQLSTPGNKTEEAPISSNAKPQDRRTEEQSVTPQTPLTPDTQAQDLQGAPATQRNQPQALDELAAELTKIQGAFNQLIEEFNMVMKSLTDKLDKLGQLLSKGAPQNQTPPAQPDATDTASSNRVAPETIAPEQNENSAQANDSNAPAPGTVEYLKQENQKLEVQIEQMEQSFEHTTSMLEQQLDTLSKQALEQKQ